MLEMYGNAATPLSIIKLAGPILVTPLPMAITTIQKISISGGQVIINGTNNNGPGGTYEVLTSTNVAAPLSNRVVLTNSSFDNTGNFSSTNATERTISGSTFSACLEPCRISVRFRMHLSP